MGLRRDQQKPRGFIPKSEEKFKINVIDFHLNKEEKYDHIKPQMDEEKISNKTKIQDIENKIYRGKA